MTIAGKNVGAQALNLASLLTESLLLCSWLGPNNPQVMRERFFLLAQKPTFAGKLFEDRIYFDFVFSHEFHCKIVVCQSGQNAEHHVQSLRSGTFCHQLFTLRLSGQDANVGGGD